MRMFDPEPELSMKRVPRQVPKKVVPSLIGEPDLARLYLFHLGAGDVLRDYSGNGDHGSITEAEWADGPHGWGLDFVETPDYVTVTPPDINRPGSTRL